MSSFTRFDAKLKVVYDKGASEILKKDYWRVEEGFRYYLGYEDSSHYVDVPRGFLTDGASVPRVFWSILPPWGEYGQAVVLHDYLCEQLGYYVDDPILGRRWKSLSRKEVDETLYEAMNVLKVTQWKQVVIEAGVEVNRLIKNPKRAVINPTKRSLENSYV
jgi:hypothetical protein